MSITTGVEKQNNSLLFDFRKSPRNNMELISSIRKYYRTVQDALDWVSIGVE